MKFADIGQQLRAYRLESGLRAEEIAARLGVSRAALYRYEKGEVIKLDTVRRLAELLKISPLSLLGIGVEYFARPAVFLERLRQIEEQAEQIILFGGALCFQTATEAFESAVAEAWTEAADALPDRFAARATVEQCLGLLGARRRAHQQRRQQQKHMPRHPRHQRKGHQRPAQRGQPLGRLHPHKGLHGLAEDVGSVHGRVGQIQRLGKQGVVYGYGSAHDGSASILM